jgi:DNA invertase Pin-like site-specific DNA recombinase
MTNCYLYLRFSTTRQERGSSKERQLEDCRAFIKRKGWTEIEVISDLGRSAWKGVHLKSGNLGKFAKRIMDGDVVPGIIVVENLDRLSRQKPRVTQRWMEDICDRGFKIATVKGDKIYDARSLEDNIMDILDVLYQGKAANDYVETLSVRSKASYRERLKAARIDNTAIHGIGPAWLKPIGKRPDIVWEPIPERVRLIHDIFEMTVAGKAPWTIAREFNERPDCPSFTGKLWERTAIVKIIRNPAIDGDRVIGEGKNSIPTGEVLRGYYGSPIVPLDVVAQARDMLNRRRRGSGRNSGAVNNLFGQKIRCGDCHGRMMQMGYQSRYLTCYEAIRGSGCTNRTTYKYRPFEAAILDSILHLALDEKFFRQAEKSNHIGLEIAECEKAIHDQQAYATRLVAMLKGQDSPTILTTILMTDREIAKLKVDLDALKTKHANAKGTAMNIDRASSAPGTAWESLRHAATTR